MTSQDKKVVVFGCQKIAVDVIKWIKAGEDGYIFPKLVGVVTHDEERDRMFSDILVSEYCFVEGIPSLRFGGKVNADIIRRLEPDLIVSAYYRKILPKEIIELPKMGCINIHPSLLPRDRGPNPTLYSVLRGDKYAGATLHYIDEGMDTGDIIAQCKVPINNMTGYELNKHMMEVGFNLFADNFYDFMNNNLIGVKQNDYEATCNIKFSNNMRYINWCMRAEDILNHLRAYAPPYACSITRAANSEADIFIEKAKIIDEPRSSRGPGCFEVIDKGLIIQTHTKPILVPTGWWKSKNVMAAGVLISKRTGRFISGPPKEQ